MNIFSKPYYPLTYFAYQAFVICPKCGGKGCVTSAKGQGFPMNIANAKFSCSECKHMMSSGIDNWEGYYVGYNRSGSCAHCGNRFAHEFGITKDPYDTGKATCPTCKTEKKYEISWFRYESEAPTDPYFGLELYFQKTVKKGVLWVYNLGHLQYLKEYLQSNIRKREMVGQYTMIARLPDFIINAKNKEAIIKTLEQFEEELKK